MRLPVAPTVAVLVVGIAAGLPSAGAATTSELRQLAPGVCSANNPANDPALRLLPASGLRNAGTQNVSVVCAVAGNAAAGNAITWIQVRVRNDRTADYPMTCTLWLGVPGNNVASTQAATVSAGSDGQFFWDGTQYGNDALKQAVNLQCSLPQGFTLMDIGVRVTAN
jgi:hypothetical protein